MKGKLAYTFGTEGEYTFYAEKANSGRSWNQRVIVCERTAENEGKPFGIMTNGVSEPNAKSITWLTQIDGSEAKAFVKYSIANDLIQFCHGGGELYHSRPLCRAAMVMLCGAIRCPLRG